MKNKFKITVSIIILAVFTIGFAVTANAAKSKTDLIGFTKMAEKAEKNYGIVLELDLVMRNDEPVYKANVIINGKRVLVYLNAKTGAEIERKDTVALDSEEKELYNNYSFKSSSSNTVAQTNTASEAAVQVQTVYSAEATVTYEKAKQIALAKVGGGTVKEIELDYENGILIYEVEIKYNSVEYEVDVDASTGEVVKYNSDYDISYSYPQKQSTVTSNSTQSSISSTQIIKSKAKEIALAKVGGGTIKEIELDYKKGQLVYEIEIKYNGMEYEIDIDACTGEIVKFKKEYDD